MLDGTVDIQYVAVGVVLVGVLVRLYAGSVVFHPRYTRFWNVLRRALVPLLQMVVYRYLPFDVKIENSAKTEEYVGHVDLDAQKLAKRVDDERDVEIPLLAGFKTDWEDRSESGTFVWYHGPRPLAGLPRWLKHYQVHITTFTTENGETVVTAHEEANPYRPDLWGDHLTKGPSFSAGEGIEQAENALEDAGVEWEVVDGISA